jgi:two-component system nitrogen regulation response regulator GlnG/two-component system response regulator HydG
MSTWEASTDEGMAAPVGAACGAPDHEQDTLVIAWSHSEPSRVGECARLRYGAPLVLGRGPARADDGHARVRFFQERPLSLAERLPLGGPGISRRQLLLSPSHAGLGFERIGACEVLHNGGACDRGVLRPGDTLTLRGEIVFVLVRRPRVTGRPCSFPSEGAGAFGCVDANGMIGESAAAWRLREELAFAAGVDTHVLVTGASGVGKELVARAIHAMSARAARAFIARSAASFPSTLIDAELFGNMRGFPNQGMPERPGLIGAADGGSVFLDEIGELPTELQARLLRVLDQSGEYHRLGESTARKSSFRLIAATNRPASALKHDLLARFALRVDVPDLNERREDVPLLVGHLLQQALRKAPSVVSRFFDGDCLWPRVDAGFIDALVRHSYSLHVRELDEIVWRSIRASRGRVLEPLALGPGSAGSGTSGVVGTAADDDGPSDCTTEDDVRRALDRHGGSATRAYRELGLSSRYALYRLMKKYAIPPASGETP